MKSIILTLALLIAGIVTANADVVTSEHPVGDAAWVEGNYFFLKSGDYFLLLDPDNPDSVIVKTFSEDSPLKATIDYALWEIKPEASPAAILYQFKNKKTQAVLSFEASDKASLNLAEGVNKWTFSSKKIQSLYDNGKKTMALSVADGDLVLASSGSDFEVYAPNTKYVLSAVELGEGFQVFQLDFDKKYEGNIFEGKDLLAKDIADKDGFVTLQIQGDETFEDGTPKYLGVDTLKTEIAGAKDVYGAKFSVDSTRKVVRPNADWQRFMFTVDLKNDSMNIRLAAAPEVNTEGMPQQNNVIIVFAGIDSKNVLTVSSLDINGKPQSGKLPHIKRKRGTPGSITTGSGVYFLKSASKKATAGKYIISYEGGIVTTNKTPSVNLPEGQWYIKETDGKYSIVDRNTNTCLLNKGEIFPVKGIANTFTLGNNTDSITVEYQAAVNLNNNFLGYGHFSKEAIAQKGYIFNILSGAGDPDNLFVVSADTILKIGGTRPNAVVFKLDIEKDSIKNEEIGMGAWALGDTLYHSVYKMKKLFTRNYVAYDEDKDALKLSSFTAPNEFIFRATDVEGKYALHTADKYVSMDISTANLTLLSNVAYFNMEEVEAPEYLDVENGFKRLTSEITSLVMNPYTFYAEMKTEGQDILRAGYEEDNFSLWIERAPSTDDRPLYYITKSVPGATAGSMTKFYLVSLRDSADFDDMGNALVGFVTNDTITTMDNSPALFAFKTTESGNIVLESQKELTDAAGKPYIGVVNNRVVMSAKGIEFEVKTAPAPVANEETIVTDIKVIGDKNGVIIMNAAARKISIFNILGQTLSVQYATSDYFRMPAPQGIVFVAIEGAPTQKAMIK